MNSSEYNYKMIRKTAMKLFREKGFENVTVKDICEVSGVPRRSFYTLFSSKDELIMSFYDLNQELLADVDVYSEVLMLNDPYSKLIALVRIQLELLLNNGRHYLSQLYRIGLQNEGSALAKMAVGQKSLASQLIAECQSEGLIRNRTDPVLLWESLTIFMIGICYLWCCEESFPLLETAISRFEDIVDAKPELRHYNNKDIFLENKS